jgi:peptidyl-prolyl cis-trans isomerase C
MRFWITMIAMVVISFHSACNRKQSNQEGKPASRSDAKVEKQTKMSNALAEVNGIPVTREEYLRYLEPYPSRMKENVQGREHILQSLIEHILMREEATRLGLTKDPDYLRKVENYKRNLLNNMLLDHISKGGFTVTEQEAREYFGSHPEEFDRPERVHVRHIQLSTEAEAKETLALARKGTPFEQLAQERSKDNSTRTRGGDLGPFSREQRPELAGAAFALKAPGELSGPVQTQRGFHILKLVRKVPAVKETFEQAREGLISRMRAKKRQSVKKDLIEGLRERAQIKTNQQALEALQVPNTEP